jgi:hypothetical protein
MISFFKRLGLFFLLSVILSTIFVFVYVFVNKISSNDIPSPHLSKSFSLNEKAEFLRQLKKNANVLAIGSSISLNNLHSATIAKQMQPSTFLNASSWGMGMRDNYLLLKILYETYHPNTLMMASSFSEFERSSEIMENCNLVKEYLTMSNFNSNLCHAKYFDLRYYMDNTKYKKHVQTAQNAYEYLVFDQYGGVNIDDTNFKINQRRWKANFDMKKIVAVNYDYLDSISTYCKLKGIKLLFFHSPLRKGIYINLGAKKTNELKAHVNHVAAILKKSNYLAIDTYNILWNDSLFIDSEHFSEKGAKKFITYCFNELDSLNQKTRVVK